MRIDAHVHLIPDSYRHELVHRRLVDFPLPSADITGLEEMMDRHEIDAAVISPSPPGVSFGDQGLTNDLARMLNEELAASRAAQAGSLPSRSCRCLMWSAR